MSTEQYKETWLAGPQETQFYTRTYTPKSPTSTKAVIVFVHGFAEHVGRYTHFHPILAERGIAVFAYDQRGYGLTAQDDKGNKSPTSAYGKSNWKDQMVDIGWAVNHAQKTFEGVPLFLMGHSMGGGEVLGFATQGERGTHFALLNSLAGVIATSPLIHQTTPASKIVRWIGGMMSTIVPYLLIPAPIKKDELSHNAEANDAYMKDPLIRQSGSLKGISDMLTMGESLLKTRYRDWPKELPAFLVHGTDDKVASYKASESFHERIPATKKKITLFPGGYHELQNEPDGVQGKLADDVTAFIEEHLHTSSANVKTSTPGPAYGQSTEGRDAPSPEQKEISEAAKAEQTVPVLPTDPEAAGISSTEAKM